MFKVHVAAQMAAFFALQAGGQIRDLKLTKLLYLTERESMRRHGHSISGDEMASSVHGPELMNIVSLANGFAEAPVWNALIKDLDNHGVGLASPVSRAELSDLSDSSIEIMLSVWSEFGEKTADELVRHTKDACMEWENPETGFSLIPAKRVFLALGISHDGINSLVRELQAKAHFDNLFQGNFGAASAA